MCSSIEGHLYAIGDCGRANQASRCPTCGARIGGTNYILEEGNTSGSEMDGATQPAWTAML